MFTTKKIAYRRKGFTLVEMVVVIAIILVIAALAAAFAPRVDDNQKLTRAVDNLEQWLLTAKMRAKRDGLATGLRFIPAPGDAPGTFSQFQYIQQPQPLTGGWLSPTATAGTGNTVPAPLPYAATVFVNGTMLLQTPNGPVATPNGNPLPATLVPPVAAITNGQVQIYNFDPTLGQGAGTLPVQWLVQMGDYLEVNGGGVYYIAGVVTSSGLNLPGAVPVTSGPPAWPVAGVPVTTLSLFGAGTVGTYGNSLVINPPGTTNFRILRQPRILIGEEPMTLPNNYAVDLRLIPDTIIPANSTTTKITWSNVVLPSLAGSTSAYPEILFAPSGAIVGSNAGSGMVFLTVYDMTMNSPDINSFIGRVGIVAVQTRTGFLGAYSPAAGAGLATYNPFLLAQMGRESGL